MLVAEAGQPGLALGVGSGVLAQHRGRVLAVHRGVVQALQQAHLGGAASRRPGADVAGLENGHGLAGAGQQARGRQPGETAADDHHVPVSVDTVSVDLGV